MNTIVAPSNTVTMLSRKSAEVTGKHHHHVVCDITVMVIRFGIVTQAEQLQGITL
ncbi:phage regulator Rha-like protein [Pseudomonas sp. ADAK2 TE3594]